MELINGARNALTKTGFVIRYFLYSLIHIGRLEMEWFVYLEPRVLFKIGADSRVILKKNCYIKSGAVFDAVDGGQIILSEGVGIGHYTCLGATKRIFIGKRTIISQCCTLMDSAHVHDKSITLGESGYHIGELILEDEITVYSKATIGPNLHIAKGAVIGANSFVNKSIEKGDALYFGAPARKIRDL